MYKVGNYQNKQANSHMVSIQKVQHFSGSLFCRNPR